MTDIPISWKISLMGAREAKARLAELKREFGDDALALKKLNQELKSDSAEMRAIGYAVSQSNRAWKLQHQTLNEVSRAMNVFGRAMRAGMNIMNTINTLTIANNTATTAYKSSMADLSSELEAMLIKREADIKKYGKNSIQVALDDNEITRLKNQMESVKKTFEDTAKNEVWTNWITAGFGIAEGMQTALQILNNKKLMEAFSSLSLKMNVLGKGAGAMWGSAFVVGAAFAIGALAASVLLPVIEKMWSDANAKKAEETGQGVNTPNSQFVTKDVKEKARIASVLPVINFFEDIKKFIDSITGQQMAYGQSSGLMQGPIQDTGLRPSISGIASQSVGSIANVNVLNSDKFFEPIKQGMVKFDDGFVFVEANNEIMTEANDLTKTNNEVIKTEISAREAAKQREEELKAEIIANKMALIANTKAVTDAMIKQAQAVGTATPTTRGGGTSAISGFIGSNGKMYSSAEEAVRNNTQPIVGRNRQIIGYKAANGFEGMVNSPTMFMAGEAGAEQVSITPARRSAGGGGAIVVNNYVSGSVISERELEKLTMDTVKNILKRAGF